VRNNQIGLEAGEYVGAVALKTNRKGIVPDIPEFTVVLEKSL